MKPEIKNLISELVTRFDLVSSKDNNLHGEELSIKLSEHLTTKKKESIDEKKRKLWDLCKPYVTATNKQDIIEFCKYWCEVDNEIVKPLSMKVRYEDEKRFCIEDRINNWLKKRFIKTPYKQQNTPDKESKKIDTSNLF